MDKMFGIDVSGAQGDVDYEKVKNAGKKFVIIKVSEGNGVESSTFQQNRAKARASGLLRMYYHFARPDLGNSPEDEANFFLSRIDDLQKGEILALDFEIRRDVWGGDIGQWVGRWIDQVQKKYNHKPLFYANLSIVENPEIINLAEIWKVRDCGLWLAHPDNNTDIYEQTQFPVVVVKQYQFGELGGTCEGVNAPVDLDVFNGNEETWLKYGYLYEPAPTTPTEPTTPTTPEPTVEELKAKVADLQSKLIQINQLSQIS